MTEQWELIILSSTLHCQNKWEMIVSEEENSFTTSLNLHVWYWDFSSVIELIVKLESSEWVIIMMICGVSVTPALFACLKCFITTLNIILGVSRYKCWMRILHDLTSPPGLLLADLPLHHLHVTLDGLLHLLQSWCLLHHHHLLAQYLRQHLLLLLSRLLLPHQD